MGTRTCRAEIANVVDQNVTAITRRPIPCPKCQSCVIDACEIGFATTRTNGLKNLPACIVSPRRNGAVKGQCNCATIVAH